MRLDALSFQLIVMVGQIFGIESEGDVMQADLGASAGGLALSRRLVGERAGIEEGDAVMLVVIADERDEFVRGEQLGAENGTP
jgi:hypothetical protein